MQKNQVHFVSFSDPIFRSSGKRLMRQAAGFGQFDSLKMYTPEHLDRDFKNHHKAILQHRTGGGYWLWKPYIIQQRLGEIREGDFLVYLDAGCTINKHGVERFIQYLDMLEKTNLGLLSFQFTPDAWRPEKNWTIEELFAYFGERLDSPIASSGQYLAGVMIFQKNTHSTALLETVMRVVDERPDLFTDEYNQKNSDRPGFMSHRHDQSVFSIARKLAGSVVLTDETMFPNGPPAMRFYSEESLQYPFWSTKIRKRDTLRGVLHRFGQLLS